MEELKKERQRCSFIINRIAGTSSLPNLESLVNKTLNSKLFIPDFYYTEYHRHAEVIAKDLVSQQVPFIIAVGGDGTVNQIGAQLIGSSSSLGVIPTGSGNGFARHLKLPMSPDDSIKLINKRTIKSIDTGLINDIPFLNVAGVGFDGHVSNVFHSYEKRGLSGYAKIILKEFSPFKSQTVLLETEDGEFKQEAFMVCFANGRQFGNRIYISPKASMSDGKLDVCLLKKPKFSYIPRMFFKMINKRELPEKYFKDYKAKTILLTHNFKYFHIDGEPFNAPHELRVKCVPSSLNVLVSR
jgi:YegS/Rv2252/BmrU family lipid kinase